MSGCDAMVVECARRGDEAAFACLVESYQRPLFNLCFRMLGEAGEAEDATQETFLRVYLRLPSYDPRRGFKNWLFAVAAHYCIDCLRRRRLVWQPWEPEQEYPDAPGSEPGPELAALKAEDEREAQALLARLAPKDRAVVVMHYWGDMSYAEMAEATGASLGAVKSRLHRARAKLSTNMQSAGSGSQRLAWRDLERVWGREQARLNLS
jgi:RNA polymerase sigma-70 factor (ECF subfamily)